MAICDHKSVGVILRDPRERFLLLTRAKPPAGRAPVAGHLDEHGSYLAAAIAETHEEVGLPLTFPQLVISGHLPNVCRRAPSHATHDGHHWIIYEALTGWDTTTRFSADETRGGDWHTQRELQQLAKRTAQWCTGQLSDAEYQAEPGLEPVWVTWMYRLGHVGLFDDALRAVEARYAQPVQV